MTQYSTAKQARDAAAKSSPATAPANPGRYLVGRLGFGGYRPEPLSSDPDKWFSDQLTKGKSYAGYAGVPGLTSTFPCLTLDGPKTRDWLKKNVGNEWSLEATVQLEYATLLLQAFSPAQLYEAVVDVMSNHLNVANGQVATWCVRAGYDRDVIRANAFGTFEKMLLASAKHPAMLIYLNNAMSFAGALNENYGRELLELHTVGRSAGYTQAEVLDSAKLMTGRCVEFSRTVYGYNLNRHVSGPVSVLGFRSANANARTGEAVGDDYLRYLARHPSTAQNLAQKFCVRFVSDSPSASLVNAVADAYLKNGTSIVAMLQTIVRSTDFWAADGAKLRRPAENVVATVRATRAQPGRDLRATGQVLSDAAAAAGQRPLAWAAPNGYPDTASAWQTAGALTGSWCFQFDLLNGAHAGALTLPDPATYLGSSAPRTVGDALQAMHGTLTGVALPASGVQSLATYLSDTASSPYRGSHLEASLAAVAALMLHGPDHATR